MQGRPFQRENKVMDQSELTGMLDFLSEMHLPILKVENLDH